MNPFLNWNDFVDIYDWEFDFMCDEQKHDVEFYLSKIIDNKTKILEFGAGTGRITLELLKSGCDVTAVDNAEKFLDKLQSRCHDFNNLKPVLSDMLSFQSDDIFDLIIISYSTFQYLLDKDNQKNMFDKLSNLLSDNGRLYIDISPFTALGNPLPDYYPFYLKFHDELQADISMFTSYTIDKANMIQSWKDKYLIKYLNGNEYEFIHYLSLRRIEIEEMYGLANNSGLKVNHLYGSFSGNEPNEDSANWIFEIVKA